MNVKKISVVTVVRNSLGALQQTWLSLERQTFQDWEWIVIDGASTDGTVEWLANFKLKNARYISEPDAGIYNAMNKGLDLVQGKFVYFLNAGDLLESKSSLGDADKFLADRQVTYFNLVMDQGETKLLRVYPDKLNTSYWYDSHLCHQAVIAPKECFDFLGKFDESLRFAADFDFFAKVHFSRKFQFVHGNAILARYDLTGVSADPENRKKVYAEYRTIYLKYFGKMKTYLNGGLGLLKEIPNFKKDLWLILPLKLIKKVQTFFWDSSLNQYVDLAFRDAINQVANPTRVLHLNSYVESGGASTAGLRYHRSLAAVGVTSALMVLHSDSNIPWGTPLLHKRGLKKYISSFKFKIERILIKLGQMPLRGHYSANWATYGDFRVFKRVVQAYKPDVIHLHWLGHGFLSLNEISELKGKIVWSLHDMWPFLAGYHLDLEVDKGDHFDKSSLKKSGLWRVEDWVWQRKAKCYTAIRSSLHFTSPSHWIKSVAQKSELIAGVPIEVVPNIVDPEEFFPIEKHLAKSALGLDSDHTVFLFGAFGPFNDDNKGYSDFEWIVNRYLKNNPSKKVTVLTFGSSLGFRTSPSFSKHFHFESIKSINLLRLIYSAADLSVVASKVESFCLVAAESLACGTPVVCYDTTGLKDVVTHLEVGYRAKAFDRADLLAGIEWVLQSSEKYSEIRSSGVSTIATRFSPEVVAPQLKKVYLLGRH